MAYLVPAGGANLNLHASSLGGKERGRPQGSDSLDGQTNTTTLTRPWAKLPPMVPAEAQPQHH